MDFILFTHDTNIFFSLKNPDILFQKVNFELSRLISWFQANRLSMYNSRRLLIILKKTRSLIINKKQRKIVAHVTVQFCDFSVHRGKESCFWACIGGILVKSLVFRFFLPFALFSSQSSQDFILRPSLA